VFVLLPVSQTSKRRSLRSPYPLCWFRNYLKNDTKVERTKQKANKKDEEIPRKVDLRLLRRRVTRCP
jgi:hypothetical protein